MSPFGFHTPIRRYLKPTCHHTLGSEKFTSDPRNLNFSESDSEKESPHQVWRLWWLGTPHQVSAIPKEVVRVLDLFAKTTSGIYGAEWQLWFCPIDTRRRFFNTLANGFAFANARRTAFKTVGRLTAVQGFNFSAGLENRSKSATTTSKQDLWNAK